MRRALLVGLREDVVNDAASMYAMLASLGYGASSLRLICDPGRHPNYRCRSPTRGNIVSGIRWLMDSARAGDHMLLFWSGMDARFQDKFEQHAQYIGAVIASVPASASLVLMMDSCPYPAWPLPYVATAMPGPCQEPHRGAFVMHRPEQEAPPCAGRVFLFAGAEQPDPFVHAPNACPAWHSTFAQAVLGWFLSGTAARDTAFQALLHMRASMALSAPSFHPVCCTLDPGHYHDRPLW